MSTITLECANCRKTFEKSKAEYQRRLAKLPNTKNFFCSLSCSSSHRNKKLHAEGRMRPPPPQLGNKYGQLYPEEYTWYIHRVTTDRRGDRTKIVMETEERKEFVVELDRVWKQQNGKCAFTGLTLERRRGNKGITKTDNPFLIASLDRIDCSKPYSADNIQWVSVGMNLARGNLSVERFAKSLEVFACEVIVDGDSA